MIRDRQHRECPLRVDGGNQIQACRFHFHRQMSRRPCLLIDFRALIGIIEKVGSIDSSHFHIDARIGRHISCRSQHLIIARRRDKARYVKRFLEDVTVPKIGLSLNDDLQQLHRLGDFKTGRFIDLQHHVNEIGVEDLSLQKLYANFFGRKISKRQQLTNWESDILNDKQKGYAATDAWSCIMLYEELMRLENTGDYELIKVDEHETSTAA